MVRKVSASTDQRGASSVWRWQCSSISRWRNLKSCRGVRRLPRASLSESSPIVSSTNWRSRGPSPLLRGLGRAGAEAVAGQVVERRAGPAQRLDQVQLVGPGAVVELLVLLLEVIGQLDRQQELDADPRMPQELVVEQRPDQGAHLARVALDLLRLVDPVDQDDDPRVAERVQHRLELAEQLVALLAAGLRGGRQRLAAELARLEPEQLPAQARTGRGSGRAGPGGCRARTTRREPAASPSRASPATIGRSSQGRMRSVRKPGNSAIRSDDDQRRAEADLEVAAAPERAEARAPAQPVPAPLDRLAGRLVVERRQQQQVAALVDAQGRQVDLLRGQQRRSAA